MEADARRANGGKKEVVPSQLNSTDLCYINVSGKQYITTFSCLEKYPDTLLGSNEREFYWIPELKSYYFNRNRDCFESILTFYQTGKEFRPLSVDDDIYEEERKFFRIDEKPGHTSVMLEEDNEQAFVCCDEGWKHTKRRIHHFLMDPRSSKFATAWHILDIMFICTSITMLVLETDPNVGHAFTDKSHPAYQILFIVNVVVIAFFTTDLAVRYITWPGLLSFWKSLFNILDILSILPFYVSIIADALENKTPEEELVQQRSYVVLRVCRIFRIVRVFKFIRHSQDLIMIIKVVAHAKKELMLLCLLLFIFSVSFGSLMYYIEQEANPDQFSSIMQGCWWAIVTITTIGYGDVYPKTWLGKMVGSVVLTLGIVFLALPMTIIVGKFSTVYEKEKGKD